MPAVHICSIGESALCTLRGSKTAVVFGVTSRGIFLRVSQEQIVFFSLESWRGPLTANLVSPILEKGKPAIGDMVAIDLPKIRLGNTDLILPEDIEIWSPPKMPLRTGNLPSIRERADRLSSLILKGDSPSPFLPLLRNAVQNDNLPGEVSIKLQSWLRSNSPRASEEPFDLLTPWLGYGSGLTPSGDDFICGFLLAAYCMDPNIKDQWGNLLENAGGETTNLSAALIKEAADGGADERLMMALAYLSHGYLDPVKIMEALLSYGSASGVDSFAGMLAAIYLIPFPSSSSTQG